MCSQSTNILPYTRIRAFRTWASTSTICTLYVYLPIWQQNGEGGGGTVCYNKLIFRTDHAAKRKRWNSLKIVCWVHAANFLFSIFLCLFFFCSRSRNVYIWIRIHIKFGSTHTHTHGAQTSHLDGGILGYATEKTIKWKLFVQCWLFAIRCIMD